MKKRHSKIKIISIVIAIIVNMLFIIFKNQEKVYINKQFYEICKNLDRNMNYKKNNTSYKVENRLDKEKKYTEIYTIKGIKEYKKGDIELAKTDLNKAIKSKEDRTDYVALFYSHKYLFEIYKSEYNYEKAKLHLFEAVKSIPKKYYNENYEDIGELIKITFDDEEFRELAIQIVSKLIEDEKYINPVTELYLRERLRSIYILSNRYAEATKNLIESIEIAKDIDATYNVADSMISLAIVLEELGGYETAVTIIEDTLNIYIEDKYKDAYVKTYGYLNLAYIEFFHLKDYERSINSLSNIEKYKSSFTEEDFRDIEIYKLIYEANSYTMDGNLDLSKAKLEKVGELLKEDKYEFYINKELEYHLAYGRYFYAKGNYDYALTLYKYVLEEAKCIDDKQIQKIILNEIIYLTKDMNEYQKNYHYVDELMNLNKEREDSRYSNYSVYIADSIKEKRQVEYNYNKYIYSARVGYISLIIILLIYMYTSKKIKKLKYLSEYDGLTNIYNRKKFETDYKRLLKKNSDFACIIMDIDNFKKINDTYGHGFGDTVLKNTSKKTQNLLSKNCNLYRIGGEEFVILAKYKNKDDIIYLSENIRKAIEGMSWKEEITITTSIGVAFSDIENKDILEVSDKNLYRAKNSGKNKVIY